MPSLPRCGDVEQGVAAAAACADQDDTQVGIVGPTHRYPARFVDRFDRYPDTAEQGTQARQMAAAAGIDSGRKHQFCQLSTMGRRADHRLPQGQDRRCGRHLVEQHTDPLGEPTHSRWLGIACLQAAQQDIAVRMPPIEGHLQQHMVRLDRPVPQNPQLQKPRGPTGIAGLRPLRRAQIDRLHRSDARNMPQAIDRGLHGSPQLAADPEHRN